MGAVFSAVNCASTVKAICLSVELSGSEKRIAGAIIDAEIQKAATAAEMQRRGAGFEHIVNQLRTRQLTRVVRPLDGD
jgi:hypothetical protein